MKKPAQTLSYRLIMRQFAIQSVLFVLLFGVVLSFQNCGGEIAGEDDLSSQADSLPLAFESQMDTLAYMSCTSAPDSNFFSFKAAAYDNTTNSGLRFRSAVRSKLKGMSASAATDLLQSSPTNSAVNQQIAIRTIRNYGNIAGAVGGFNLALSDENIVTSVRQQTGTNYAGSFSNVPAGAEYLSTPIAYSTNEDGQAAVRSYVTSNTSNTSALSLTFGAGTGAALSPKDPRTSVYGKGYTFAFKNPTASVGNQRAKLLSSATEINLETGSATGTNWDCPSTMVFKIVRPLDRGASTGSLCLAGQSTGDLTTLTDVQGGPSLAAAYAKARKLLSPFWVIDMVNACIVPRSTVATMCYGAIPPGQNINYSAAGSCIPGSNTCAHYLSVCNKL